MSGRRAGRVAATVVVALGLLALVAVGQVNRWSALVAQRSTVDLARLQTDYARPVIELLATLVLADVATAGGRTAAVAPVSAAVQAVAAVDAVHGGELGTTARLTDLSRRIGAAAWSDASRLAAALLGTVAPTGLGAPGTDLTLAALRDLPTALLQVARTVDPTHRDALVASRAAVGAAVDAVGIDLARLARDLEGAAVASSIIPAWDRFQADAVPVGPATDSAQLRDAPTVDGVNRLVASGRTLMTDMLDQIESGLSTLDNGVTGQQRTVMLQSGGLLVGLVVLLWLAAPRRATGPVGEPVADVNEPTPAPEVALFDARDLLGVEELVHVGRAVRVRRPEPDNAD